MIFSSLYNTLTLVTNCCQLVHSQYDVSRHGQYGPVVTCDVFV